MTSGEVADQAVADPEDDRAQRARAAAGSVPRLALADLGHRAGDAGRGHAVAGPSRVGVGRRQALPDAGVLALVLGDGRDLGGRRLDARRAPPRRPRGP